MMSMGPSKYQLMGTIAEGSISWHFTITQFIIARLRNIKGDRSASCQDPLALAITERWDLSMTTSTPIIYLSSVEVHVGWEYTCKCWERWWSILALFVRSAFCQRYYFLFRKICHIIHCNLRSWRRRLLDWKIERIPLEFLVQESWYLFHELSFHNQ